MMEQSGGFIQIGEAELRDPVTGALQNAVPLYIAAEDWAVAAEERLIEDLGSLFAKKMKQYRDQCRESGAAI